MNQWNLIRNHYRQEMPKIMAEKSNEWGIEPYAWEVAGIHLTPIEAWLWHDIRTVDLVFYPQFLIGSIFVDFANPKAKVVIECDGLEYHQDKAKDKKRDEKLISDGWTVYRISGKDCRDGVDGDVPSKSKARQFVEEIATWHCVKRGTT